MKFNIDELKKNQNKLKKNWKNHPVKAIFQHIGLKILNLRYIKTQGSVPWKDFYQCAMKIILDGMMKNIQDLFGMYLRPQRQ